jgi:acetyltransferase-like isoleucine patch superfamily enzyme
MTQTQREFFPAMPGRSHAADLAPDFHSDAKIGSGVVWGRDLLVHENVEIGDGVQIGNRVTLRNCRIGAGVRIEDNCIIGYESLTGGFSHKLAEYRRVESTVIGAGSLIRTGCTIYQSVSIGENCWINHNVLLREHTRIGSHTCIGSLTAAEGYLTVGSHVLVHTQAHLAARITIEDYVFIAPCVVFTNGHPMNYAREVASEEQGAVVRFGAQIGAQALIMPRVTIGCEAWVGPGTLVNRDVPHLAKVLGSPARIIGPVEPEMRLALELRRRYYQGEENPPSAAVEEQA